MFITRVYLKIISRKADPALQRSTGSRFIDQSIIPRDTL